MVFSPVPQRRAFVAYGATGVAYQLLTREKNDRDPDEFLPDDKFIFGSANSYQFQFSFPGNLLWADLLADRRFDPRAKPQPLASMPEGFRKSVEAELEKLRKSGG